MISKGKAQLWPNNSQNVYGEKNEKKSKTYTHNKSKYKTGKTQQILEEKTNILLNNLNSYGKHKNLNQ